MNTSPNSDPVAGDSGERRTDVAGRTRSQRVDEGATQPVGRRSDRTGQGSGAGRTELLHRLAGPLLGLVLVATLLLAVVLPASPAPTPQTAPVRWALPKVCAEPPSGQQGSLLAVSLAGQIEASGLDAGSPITRHASPWNQTDPSGTQVLRPQDNEAALAAGTLAGATLGGSHQLTWTPCTLGVADQIVQFPQAAGAALLLINSEATPASLGLSLTGTQGAIEASQLTDVTVPAHGSRRIDLAPAAPGYTGPLSVRLRTVTGRVSVLGQFAGPDGSAVYLGAARGQRLIVPGIPAKTDRVLLLITNPNTSWLQVTIEGLGPSGRYQLPSGSTQSVGPGQIMQVEVTQALAGEVSALQLSANASFSASALIAKDADLELSGGVSLPDGTADTATSTSMLPLAGSGVLVITNASTDPQPVHLDWGPGQAAAEQTVPAGTTMSVPVPQGAVQVSLKAAPAVLAVAALSGRSADPAPAGLALAPLQGVLGGSRPRPVLVDPLAGD